MSVWRRRDDEDDEEHLKEERGLYILKNITVITVEYIRVFYSKWPNIV